MKVYSRPTLFILALFAATVAAQKTAKKVEYLILSTGRLPTRCAVTGKARAATSRR